MHQTWPKSLKTDKHKLNASSVKGQSLKPWDGNGKEERWRGALAGARSEDPSLLSLFSCSEYGTGDE